MIRIAQGLSLIELLITLGFLVTITAIAIPSFAGFIVEQRVDNEIFRVSKLLQVARNSAINSGYPTTVCPLNKSNNCTEYWSEPLTVFTDINKNQQYDPVLDEQIISTKPAIFANDELKYAKFRRAITYAPSGHLTGWGHNGTFRYCPDKHLDKAKGIVVATSGRFYKTFQSKTNRAKTRSNRYIKCN